MIHELTTSTASNEAQIIEFSHLIFHNGRTIAQLRREVLIIPRSYCYNRSVHYLAQGEYFKGNW